MKKKRAAKKQNHLFLEIQDARWKKVSGLKPRLEKIVQLVLANVPEAYCMLAKRAQATLLLASDKEVRRLNHDYRGMNKPTNVLSFPQFTAAELRRLGKGREPVYIGDIAMAFQYTKAEAASEDKILINHISHLLIHGLLHLFGYDHLTDAAAARMERLEKKLMAELGLPDPYAPAPAKASKARIKRKRA